MLKDHHFYNKPRGGRGRGKRYGQPQNYGHAQSDYHGYGQFNSPQLPPSNFSYQRKKRPQPQSGMHQYAATPNLHSRNYNQRNNEMMKFRIIRVANLAHFVNSNTIFNIFSQYGYISAIKIACFGDDREAFVNFYENSECQVARDFLNKVPLFDKPMRVGLTKFISIEENEFFERSDKVKKMFLKEN